MTTQTVNTSLTNAMQTVAINGAYNASRALSKWLRRGVRLTCDGFQSIPVSEACNVVGEPDEAIAAIHMPLTGDVGGHLLLTFPESVALTLVDIMMEQPEGTSTSFGELEQSCLQETGNIVGSAYANSLSKWLKLRIEPSVPTFVHDMASAVLDPLLVEAAAHGDEILLATTDFVLDGCQMQWGLLLVPDEDSMRSMESRCELENVRQNALQTIAINGAFNASRAMSKWLKRGVKIATDGFQTVDLHALDTVFDDQPMVALHMPLSNNLHGHMLLMLSKPDALTLASLLVGTPTRDDQELTELEISSLEETGNIITSSFVNSWSTWLDFELEPGPPEFTIDMPAAILDSIVAEQAQVGDEVFLSKTSFAVDENMIELTLILMPNPSAMRLIEAACR